MTTATRRPNRSRSGPGSRKPARRAQSATRRTRSRAGAGIGERREGLSRLIGRQADDVWGLVLLLVAVLFGLAVYSAGLAGPAGRVVDHLTADAVGWARVLLPPVLAYLGWVLIREVHPRRTPPRGGTGPAERVVRPPVRVSVGAVIVVVGLVLAVWGARGTFEDDLDLGRMDRAARRAVRAIGTAGTVARGAVVVIVGAFLLAAGIDHRAGQAKGLDASLVAVGHHPYGVAVLVVVAVGLACFGVFSIVAARYRRL